MGGWEGICSGSGSAGSFWQVGGFGGSVWSYGESGMGKGTGMWLLAASSVGLKIYCLNLRE